MTNLGDQLEKVQISDEPVKRRPLNARNDGIPDELKESARKFDQHFQDLELREETRYRVSNYSSNLFTKNAETSQKYRKMGNELYSSQRYEESLNSYNQVGFSRNGIQCMAIHLNAIYLDHTPNSIHLGHPPKSIHPRNTAMAFGSFQKLLFYYCQIEIQFFNRLLITISKTFWTLKNRVLSRS